MRKAIEEEEDNDCGIHHVPLSITTTENNKNNHTMEINGNASSRSSSSSSSSSNNNSNSNSNNNSTVKPKTSTSSSSTQRTTTTEYNTASCAVNRSNVNGKKYAVERAERSVDVANQGYGVKKEQERVDNDDDKPNEEQAEADECEQEEEEDEEDHVDYSPLIPQAIVGFIDSISLMIVLPSLVFYVKQAGGTQKQYGIICSAFALASFTFKPILGYWSDHLGNKFRVPYLTSIAVATFGAFLYFLASVFITIGTDDSLAIKLILAGRLLGGCGAANNSLGYTYIAQVIPQKHMTKAGAILSMIRVFGMTIAPGFNALLSRINFHINVLDITTIHVDPLNVVGLVIMCSNMIGFCTIYLHLKEPPEKGPAAAPEPSNCTNRHRAQQEQQRQCHKDGYEKIQEQDVCDDDPNDFVLEETTNPIVRTWRVIQDCFRSDLLVPILAYFTLNFNFQFMETGLAPAANLALGWETVTISIIFGIDSILLFFVYIGTYQISARGVTDVMLMKIGLLCSIIGYTLMYMWWERGAMTWMFVTPIIVCTAAFPFLGTPTRSIFAYVVSQNPSLSGHQGTMQAILSMMSSVAGFTAPYFIAGHVLRTPDDFNNGQNHEQHVLNGLAFVAPALSLVTLLGLNTVQDQLEYENVKKPATTKTDSCVPQEDGEDNDDDDDDDEKDCLTGLQLEAGVKGHHRDCISNVDGECPRTRARGLSNVGITTVASGVGETCPLLIRHTNKSNDIIQRNFNNKMSGDNYEDEYDDKLSDTTVSVSSHDGLSMHENKHKNHDDNDINRYLTSIQTTRIQQQESKSSVFEENAGSDFREIL